MRTLFFDTSSHTGWAFGGGGQKVRWGSFTLSRSYDAVAPFLAQAKAHIEARVLRFAPDQIGFEAPLLMQRDNPMRLRKLYGLAIKVEEVAFESGIPCVEASLGNIRTHFLGKGYPRKSKDVKAKVVAKCKSLGWAVTSNDEADALAGLSYLLALDDPAAALGVTPLFAGAT
jgi:hypothetical protein